MTNQVSLISFSGILVGMSYYQTSSELSDMKLEETKSVQDILS